MLRSARKGGCAVALVALSGCWTAPRATSEHGGSRAASKPREARAQRAAVEDSRFDVAALSAQASDGDFEALLELADDDENGRVTPEEVEALVARRLDRQIQLRFERLDRDRDGRVTSLEVLTMDVGRFARFDRDGDGAFTLAELSHAIHGQALGRCRLLFARWDQDRDGVLSAGDREGIRLARAAAQR